MKQLWQCPKCKREFKNIGQVHSCKSITLEEHFKNKKLAEELFFYLKKEIEKNIGPVKIETPPCCIHLVSSYTFSGVWAMKDKLRFDFRIDEEIKNKKIWKFIKMSPHRYLYYLEIKDKKDIDKELLGWIKKAYYLN
jgi:hypothetical protein